MTDRSIINRFQQKVTKKEEELNKEEEELNKAWDRYVKYYNEFLKKISMFVEGLSNIILQEANVGVNRKISSNLPSKVELLSMYKFIWGINFIQFIPLGIEFVGVQGKIRVQGSKSIKPFKTNEVEIFLIEDKDNQMNSVWAIKNPKIPTSTGLMPKKEWFIELTNEMIVGMLEDVFL